MVVVVVVVEVVVSYMLGCDSDMYTFIEFNDADYVKQLRSECLSKSLPKVGCGTCCQRGFGDFPKRMSGVELAPWVPGLR